METEYTHNPISYGTDILEWRRLLRELISQTGIRNMKPYWLQSSFQNLTVTSVLYWKCQPAREVRWHVLHNHQMKTCMLWICLLIIKAKVFLFLKVSSFSLWVHIIFHCLYFIKKIISYIIRIKYIIRVNCSPLTTIAQTGLEVMISPPQPPWSCRDLPSSTYHPLDAVLIFPPQPPDAAAIFPPQTSPLPSWSPPIPQQPGC